MSGFLLDTNVISEQSRPTADLRVMAWLTGTAPEQLFVSAVTIGELRQGIESLPDGRKRRALETWMSTELPRWLGANSLPVTKQIADLWGRLTVQSRRSGHLLGTADGLIAATALEHDLTLVTRNIKDFAGLDLALLNPWD